MTKTAVLFALLLLSAGAIAQTRPSFEVVSIKPAEPLNPGAFKMGVQQDPGLVRYTGLPLSRLIAQAYKLKGYQVTGPDWMNSARFDITATLPKGAPRTDIPAMLQTMLEERFGLKAHTEQKEMPVYALVVGKNGIKMTVVPDDPSQPSGGPQQRVRMAPGSFEVERIGMPGFADLISPFVDRPVVDETKTTANYKLKLEFAMDPSMMNRNGAAGMKIAIGPGGGGGEAPPAADPSAPSIFTAVQEQLGLKLEAKKAAVEILVVDKLEKSPTEN